MQRMTSRRVATAVLLLIATTGCQSAMSSSESSSTAATQLPAGHYSNVGAEWPLKFRAHYFGGHCFDTQACEILYRGFPHGPGDKPSPSVASYDRPLDKLLSAGRGPIGSFPPPAKVSWKSKNGTPHEAEIDIGEIFKDQLIRHNVAREDAADPASSGTPGVILEVNDRTINVYMKSAVWLKQPKDPDNPLSNVQRDLIKVFSQSY